MAKQTNYKALDDIGFIGVDSKRSPGQLARAAKETSSFIKSYLSGNKSAKGSSVVKAVKYAAPKRWTAVKQTVKKTSAVQPAKSR